MLATRYALIVFGTLFFFLGHPKAQAQRLVSVSDSILLGGLVHIEYAPVLPAGDLADRFGFHNDLGLSILIKNRNNWLFGVAGDYYFGNSVREDSILDPLRSSAGGIIGTDGELHLPILNMKGFSIGAEVGKVLPFGAVNPNSGTVLLAGFGFHQHKIGMVMEQGFLPQLDLEDRKGYDRLANGLYLSQFVGWQIMGENRFINLRAGFQFTEAFTAPRRDFDVDLGTVPEGGRLDLQIQFNIAWVLPVYEKPRTIYYTH